MITGWVGRSCRTARRISRPSQPGRTRSKSNKSYDRSHAISRPVSPRAASKTPYPAKRSASTMPRRMAASSSTVSTVGDCISYAKIQGLTTVIVASISILHGNQLEGTERSSLVLSGLFRCFTIENNSLFFLLRGGRIHFWVPPHVSQIDESPLLVQVDFIAMPHGTGWRVKVVYVGPPAMVRQPPSCALEGPVNPRLDRTFVQEAVCPRLRSPWNWPARNQRSRAHFGIFGIRQAGECQDEGGNHAM